MMRGRPSALDEVLRRWWPGRALQITLCLSAGLTLRLWFVAHAPQISGDGLLYADIAHNWFWHGIYGITRAQGIHPTLIRLPGYPLFLAVCFALFGVQNFHAVMLVHVAVDLATCGLIAGTADRLFGSPAARTAIWLALLCPFTANYVATALTETLSIFFVALAFYALTRLHPQPPRGDRWLCITGFALSCATLLRPEQGLLTAAVLTAMALRIYKLRPLLPHVVTVALAGLLAVAPLAPWAARNWLTFHVMQPLAPRNANDPGEAVPVAFERWFRTWGIDFISTDQVYWNYDNDEILAGNLPARAFDSEAQRRETTDLLNQYNLTTSASPAFEARFAILAEERIRGHRLRYDLALPLARLANMLFRPRTELLALPLDWWNWHSHPIPSSIAVALVIVNATYFAAAAMGLWCNRGRWNWLIGGMILFCMLRCGMLATIDNSEPRYTLELFPVLIVLAASLRADVNAGRSSDSSRA